MAQTTFRVCMDESLKKQFDKLCSEFEITSPEPKITRECALQAFMVLREQAGKDFSTEMSLDEINEEIRRARNGEADAK